jgi:PAS domain S-box-containing protein
MKEGNTMKRTKPKGFCNLYKFIRLILGNDIPDRKIAQQWRMNGKNFYEFKVGRYPVPKVERLVSLAKVLKVNEYFVFAVSIGESANYVYNIIKDKGLLGEKKLSVNQINKILEIMADNSNRYWKLFDNDINCGECIVDVKTAKIVDTNKIAGDLTGWPEQELVGQNWAILVNPLDVSCLQDAINDFVTNNRKIDLRIFDVVRKNGKIIPVICRTTLFEISGNKYLHFMVWDISKLKKIHKKASSLIKRKKRSLSLCLTS